MKFVVVFVCLLAAASCGPQSSRFLNNRGFFQRSFPSQLHSTFARRFGPVAPQQPYYNRPIAILKDVRENQGDGYFQTEFEADNGISVNAFGTPGSEGQSNHVGGFSFTFPDGRSEVLTYVADELGYRPDSDLLPKPHPLPPHAVEQIRVAEEQRARGIRWD